MRYVTAINYRSMHGTGAVSGRSSIVTADTIGDALAIALDKVRMMNRSPIVVTAINIREIG